MRQMLEYPYDNSQILKKRRKIKKDLLQNKQQDFIRKKIAVLGGSTTHDIIEILEIFLLKEGIFPIFYESEYGQYWQDAMFDAPELVAFKPDFIYIHTSSRNLQLSPSMHDTPAEVDEKLNGEFARFQQMWAHLSAIYGCVIIQNNFEMPFYRLLGNLDSVDHRGQTRFVIALNQKFAEYAQHQKTFYINDINYLSASFGLDKWSDPLYWHMYKYCLCLNGIPELAASISHIIKAILGKNKKLLVLDLDNTLWGGVIGDDEQSGIEIGVETSLGQVHHEFQTYLKRHKDLGILLAINSKNDMKNALLGLQHPSSVLAEDDFVNIKANWNPKDQNMLSIAKEVTLLPESFVFVDDNPAERDLVRRANLGSAVPEIGRVQNYIKTLDHNGYFEVVQFSEDDANRSQMYQQNMQRLKEQNQFSSYDEYLKSLEMQADITPFLDVYLPRIAQLTNKSNQFNLSTKRYSENELKQISKSTKHLCFCGKLKDKFGDNGIVSVVAGCIEDNALHINLWLMSCRVLKRGMEDAMMDAVQAASCKKKLTHIIGYYYKTEKNAMVANFYSRFGFENISNKPNGDTVWKLALGSYTSHNQFIEVCKNEQTRSV